MPGMPIFQDSPSQLKGQIYVLDSTTSNIVPLELDTTGSLPINGSVTFTAGAEVSLAAGTEVGLASGAEVGLATGTEVALATGTEVALATGTTVGLEAGTEVTLATGTDIDTVSTVTAVTTVGTVTNDVGIVNGGTALNVGLSEGTNLIGKVENQLVFTNLDSFVVGTPLSPQTVGAGPATVAAISRDISLESSYNWFIKNEGTAATQDITLVVEISPDGVNWMEDTGTIISVAFGESKMITVTNFLQFARFVITGGTAETTVISSFQAQH